MELDRVVAEDRKRAAAPPPGTLRLPPKAAGEMADHIGLLFTVANRAYARLQHDRIRPSEPNDLLADATVSLEYFIRSHVPARGRLSTYFLAYGPSFVCRAWRIKEGGLYGEEARGGKPKVPPVRVRTCNSNAEAIEMERRADRGVCPLEAAIANEERASQRKIAAELLELVPHLDLLELRGRGVKNQMIGEWIGVNKEAVSHRVVKAMREVRELLEAVA